MPFNGSGAFTPLGAPQFPAVVNTTIIADYYNNVLNDVFNGLSNAITRDGQSPAQANIPMGGFRLTGLGDALSAGQALTYGGTPPSFAAGLLHLVRPTSAGNTTGFQIDTADTTKAWAIYAPAGSDNLIFSSKDGSYLAFDATRGGVSVGPTGQTFTGYLFAVRASAGNAAAAIAGPAQATLSLAGNGGTPGAGSLDIRQDATNAGYITNTANAGIVFGANNTESFRIGPGGEVGIKVNGVFTGYPLGVNGSVISAGGESTTGFGYRVINAAQNGGGNFTAFTGAGAGVRLSGEAGKVILAAGGSDRWAFNPDGSYNISTGDAKMSLGSSSVGTGQLFITHSTQATIEMRTVGNAVSLGMGTNSSGASNAWGAPTGTGFFGIATSSPLVFGQNGLERMRINNSGYLGIGTTNPGGNFQVVSGSMGVVFGNAGGGDNYIDGTSLHVRTKAGADIMLVDTAAQTVSIGGTAGALRIAGNITRFESAEQAVQNSTFHSYSVTHGGPRAPDIYQALLRCKTAEAGYGVGVELNLDSEVNSGATGSSSFGFTTTIGWVQALSGANTIPVRHGSTGAVTYVTAANWRVVFKAIWL